MIIDTHVHIGPYGSLEKAPIWEPLKDHYRRELDAERAEKAIEAAIDTTVEALIRDMDEAGVDKAVVNSPSSVTEPGGEKPKTSPWESNEYAVEAIRKYPDRLIAFVWVDPLRKDSSELVRKAVTEWGFKGIKMWLPYRVIEAAVEPVLKTANDLEIPVLFHTGMDILPFRIYDGDPRDLDVLIKKFPKVKFIAAHHSLGFEELLTEMMTMRRGMIWSDLALWQRKYDWCPGEFTMKMRSLMDRVPHSIMMGTDWPMCKQPLGHKEWFDVIRNLKVPEQVLKLGLGIKDFTQEEKDLILGENARALLGI
jgi:predicted TIM-barrel fold metal-dependent hydrolase